MFILVNISLLVIAVISLIAISFFWWVPVVVLGFCVYGIRSPMVMLVVLLVLSVLLLPKIY